MKNFPVEKAKDCVYDDPVLLPCSLVLTWKQLATDCASDRELSKLIMRKNNLLSCWSPIEMEWKQYTKEQKFASLAIQQLAAKILWKSGKGDQSPKISPSQNEKKNLKK